MFLSKINRRTMASTYRKKVLQWQAERDASLRVENGWLALAGLFWFDEGENTIGSDPSSQITLPARAPAALGKFVLAGQQVTLQVGPGIAIEIDGRPAKANMILRPDTDEDPSFITLDDLRMVVIQRPRGMGVRLWDNLRPERRVFPPREWFPINKLFRVPARYVRFPKPKQVLMPDTFGEVQEGTMDGQVTFELGVQTFSLDVSELEGHRLYIQFRDLTSGSETYPGGRYYYSLDPVIDGRVTLDFNYSYSPPCAFTDYATCLFAPEQNFLSARIAAGEFYRGHR